ncbi:MAG: hypothetical protein K2K56_13950 [Lachnospiraceae bacterium]|nr:hypothetical protein [Lachnospiraceae bacterium]
MTGYRFRVIWSMARIEFGQWIYNSKMIILSILMVFIQIQIIEPLRQCGELMNSRLSFLEPFAALGNSGIVALVVPIVFLVLIADFPQANGMVLFFHIRCNKKIWLCGQVLFSIGASLLMVLFLALVSGFLLSDSGSLSGEFSEAVTHYVAVFPEKSGDYVVELLPENLYNQMSLQTAVLHTSILMFLNFILISRILLLASLLNKKRIGIFVNVFLIACGAACSSLRLKLMWFFPLAHFVLQVHFREYLTKEIFPVYGSYIYFVMLNFVLLVLCFVFVDKYQVAGGDNI